MAVEAVAGTKYGIKLAETEYTPGKKKILGVSRFESGNVLAGFTEITKEEYDRITGALTYFHYWDTSANDIVKDNTAESDFNAEATKSRMRNQLKYLFFEIQFTTELGEDTSALESEYDDLLIEYNALTEEEV